MEWINCNDNLPPLEGEDYFVKIPMGRAKTSGELLYSKDVANFYGKNYMVGVKNGAYENCFNNLSEPIFWLKE